MIQLLGHHDYVCTRHRIWIGPPDLPDRPQPALPQLPEVVAAQHAHRRLLRRFGPAATYDAVLTGFLICGRRWDTIADSSREPGPDDAWHHWKRRSNLLIPPGTEAATFSASRLFATVYPEAVHIAALLASRHWRRRAAGGPADQRAFAAEIGRRLGQPDYRPQRLGDPITQWMEQTCWRPPSQPSVHFRMERTFGGPSHRKPDQRGIDSTPGRAQQFAADRNTVSSMIYHRSLAIIRSDISDHQRETRAAKLHAHPPTSTGNATLPGIEGDTLALAGEQFERPQPVSSPFWDTAIEPIPWPPRPRQTVRSRPGPWPTSTTQGQESAN